MVISALLVGAVTTFLWGANWEMEATLVRAGGERARAAAGQIANLMGPGSHASMQKWRAAAGDQDVRKYVRDSRDDTSNGMRAHLLALVEGTGAWSIEVWSAGGSRLLEVSTPLAEAPNAPVVVLPPLTGPPALGFNALQAVRGVVFHDSAVEIVDTPAEGMPAPLGPLGYLVFRSILTVNPPGALNRLVGGDAVIQIGNTAGGAWTDLSTIVPPPPVDFTASETETAEYRTREGDRRVGGMAIVAGTPWAVWVEFPRALLVAPAHTFLRRMIGFALIVVGIGGMLVRSVSSRITRPLHALAHAADDIAAGEYSRTINVTRSDEIGRAARAFNAMAADVRDSHQQLEARVLERTQALEALGASEAHYRTIVEVALDCIITIDADGNVVEFNPAAERTFGYEKQDVVGRELTALLVPVSSRADHRTNIARFLATGGRSPVGRRLEMTVAKRDGSEFPVEMALSAVGPGRGFAIIMQDVTERRKAAMVLEESQAERKRLRETFLSHVSHELRTPLTAILGWSNMLLAGRLEGAAHDRALDIIHRNAQSQNQLISDLLDVSRIISGKLRLDLRTVELPAVIEAAVEATRPAAEAKGVRLTTALDPRAGPINGDADRLQQVVWNLITNAIKFTGEGGEVAVELRSVDSRVEITVRDSGMGIEPEFLPHIFDRFRQADPGTNRIHGGMGLGLSIVRQLVELHGGTVRAESEGEGKGATFTVSLPFVNFRREPERAEGLHFGAAGHAEINCPPSLHGLRVLAVDDEADTREMIRAVLEHCKMEVITAASASEALEVVAKSRPDVLISDLGMPGEDGYALIAKVRALPAERGGHIPAAALTAYVRAEDRVKVLRSGFQLHVSKPLEPNELVAVVANLAGRLNG
jgi:PAS domain S-box-containing protein